MATPVDDLRSTITELVALPERLAAAESPASAEALGDDHRGRLLPQLEQHLVAAIDALPDDHVRVVLHGIVALIGANALGAALIAEPHLMSPKLQEQTSRASVVKMVRSFCEAGNRAAVLRSIEVLDRGTADEQRRAVWIREALTAIDKDGEAPRG